MPTIFQQPVLAKEATAQKARALANGQPVSASQAHETCRHCFKHPPQIGRVGCAKTCVWQSLECGTGITKNQNTKLGAVDNGQKPEASPTHTPLPAAPSTPTSSRVQSSPNSNGTRMRAVTNLFLNKEASSDTGWKEIPKGFVAEGGLGFWASRSSDISEIIKQWIPIPKKKFVFKLKTYTNFQVMKWVMSVMKE